ncbi:MAG: M48 family metalloprotease [Alphaproteobacteria bacterium]|nr:M48 family metalloprotease [Alphaproteobacteria bacterium]
MIRRIIAYLSVAIAAFTPMIAHAGGLIRDAEVEYTLRAYANPIFQSAGIPSEDIRILIVNDPAVNAFVAGGLNIFINTGLIRVTRNPGMLIGVIAHETGHISGAHLSQFSAKTNRALLGSAISAVLGAAAIAGGAGSAGAGIITGGQNIAMRNFFTEVRINEQSADHAALKFLDDNEISSAGVLEMFETLRRNESGAVSKRDPYLQTHPLTSERVATVRNHIKESTIPKNQVPSQFVPMHARMVAKLAAFMESRDVIRKLYPESRKDIAARYARAIADFRAAESKKAIAAMRQLIKEKPNDPFFQDTLGQILFETGDLNGATTAYQRASVLLPDSALIMTDYAKTLIARDDPALLGRAIALLERATALDDSNDFTWRQLAIAYGKRGDLGTSYAALAEEAALQGDFETVLQHVKRARSHVQGESAIALQIDDLERDAREQLIEQKKNSLF